MGGLSALVLFGSSGRQAATGTLPDKVRVTWHEIFEGENGMQRPATILWLVIVLMAGIAVAESPPPASAAKGEKTFESVISSAAVRKHIEYLASPELKGRSGPQARVAAEYIKAYFKKFGLKPLFAKESYFQEIPGKADDKGNRPIIGQNVGAWIRGSDATLRDEFVIIGAHYDHLGVRNGKIYRGADDNASGVAMLLEAARYLAAADRKPRRSMVFLGFDLEERMLWGSRWFAAHPPWPLDRVKLFVTADMIGRSLGDLPMPAVFVLGSEHAPQLKTVLNQTGHPRGLEVARLGIDLIGTRSDYGPFRDRKIPFLFFSTGEHPDYHTPRDVPERIDYEKAAKVSGLILKICQNVAAADSPPEWTDKVGTDIDEAKSLHRIATLLLEAEETRKFSDLQRLLITHAKTRTGQIVERGEMTTEERTWLIRVAQIMLLSVF